MRTRGAWVGVRGAWLLGAVIVLSGCAVRITAPPEPPVSVRRGDQAFRDEKYTDAVQAYHDYLVAHTASDPYTARVLYKTALAEYRLGQYADTLSTLRDLDELYPARRWVQAEALRGDAEAALKNPLLAMQAWDTAWSVAGAQDRPKLRVRVERLEATMTPQQLADARQTVTHDELAAMLDRQIAQATEGVAPVAPAPGAPAPVASAPVGGPPDEEERADIVMAEPPPEPARREIARAEPMPEAPRTAEPESVVEVEPGWEAPQPAPGGEAAAPAIEVTGSDESAAAPAPATPGEKSERAAVGDRTAPAGEEVVILEEPSPMPTPPQTLYGHEVVMAETPRPGRAVTPKPDASAAFSAEPPVPIGSDVHVACLLPLSGPSKGAGEKALRGIRLVFREDDGTLVLKDTGSVAADAARLYAEVAQDPSVLAVIGPTDREEAAAVAAQADRLHLPTLLLTAGPTRPFAMPLGVDESEETARLLDYAFGPLRVRRFAVLHPRDASGSARAAAFSAAVSRRGGSVVGTVAYPPGQLATMTNYDTVRAWRAKRDVQALFVPDSSAGVARFAQFLESTVPDVTLLGGSGWEQLAAEGSMPGVYGVLFADSFFAGSARPATRDFVTRFQVQYGTSPGAVEAEGFDAARLARAALEAGARDRGNFAQAVRAVPADLTASGAYRFTTAGVERSLFLLQISDGTVREVETAAQAGTGTVASHTAADAE